MIEVNQIINYLKILEAEEALFCVVVSIKTSGHFGVVKHFVCLQQLIYCLMRDRF
jgi:hypothetical protein